MSVLLDDLPQQVSDFKKHPLFPFADFRTNDASFLLLELFWTQVVREAIGDDLFSRCQPLQEIDRDNGSQPFYNATMVDFWIPEIDRGGRVILSENHDSSPLIEDAIGDERFRAFFPFVYYNDNRLLENGHEFPQIVCGSDMACKSIESTQRLFREFLVDRISVDSIEERISADIEEFEKHRNYPTQAEWDEYLERLALELKL